MAEGANPLSGLSAVEQTCVRRYIDPLLVLTAHPVPENMRDGLVVETFPLFRECGRQIGPRFRTMEWFLEPEERHRDFVARVREEKFVLFASE